MVKIINGEIVQDDDPRAIEWERRQREPWRGNQANATQQQHGGGATNRFGTTQQQQQGGNNGANPQQNSPLHDVNNKLITWGLPTFTVAGFTVQPIMSVTVLLALLMWGGMAGLIVAGLWYVFGKDRF